MRRELPPEPHLDHLKKQAKDLLDAHKRGDRAAIERIRAALPSLAASSEAEAARAPFALHDAQSVIAREYGFKSWKELLDDVTRRRASALPEALRHALVGGPFQALTGIALPRTVSDAVKETWSASDGARAMAAPIPDALPLLAARNALIVPGAVAPLHIGRASSLAALDAAQKQTPPTLAVFAQRDAASDDVRVESLYPVGCQVLLTRREAAADGHAFIVIRGLRWIALTSLDPAGTANAAPYATARVTAADADASDDAGELPVLVRALRERARTIAKSLPDGDRAVALIDAVDDAEHLANLVVANLPCSVDDKARYAAERTLVAKLHLAMSLAGLAEPQ